MYASTSFSSQLAHELLVESNTRRLLLQEPFHQAPANSPASTSSHNSTDSYFGAHHEFDANVVLILAVLLCAFICSLGLNSIIRCALRFPNVAINNSDSSSPQLPSKGIKKKALKTFPTVSYSAELKLPGLDAECMICLSEFTKGDKVRILPKCNHGFHIRCIDKWLKQHSSCPKCRQCLIETCQKIVGSQRLTVLSLPVPEVIIRIHPLEPEALERTIQLKNTGLGGKSDTATDHRTSHSTSPWILRSDNLRLPHCHRQTKHSLNLALESIWVNETGNKYSFQSLTFFC